MQWTCFQIRLMGFIIASSVMPATFAASEPPFSPQEVSVLEAHLISNMATPTHVFHKLTNAGVIDSRQGAVLAAAPLAIPHFSQDYTFHWTRDAALAMQAVLQLERRASPAQQAQYDALLINYLTFEDYAEQQPSRPGENTLGQPKFNINGSVWEEPWARPQNDGPALRAITYMEMPVYLMSPYEASTVMANLDYVCDTWKSPTYDLWEEVQDTDHFYTKMVQRKSLLMGADFMRMHHRTADALRYEETANAITQSLAYHWQPRLGAYTETIHQLDQKGGGLDSSVLLGVLHGRMNEDEGPYTVSDAYVMSTVANLKRAFADIYPVNAGKLLTPLMGRYPSDIYDGDQFVHGNPWVLITNALAEYDYRLAAYYQKKGIITITPMNATFFQSLNPLYPRQSTVLTRKSPLFHDIIDDLMTNGDQLLARVKSYQQTYPDGSGLHYAEQINKDTGLPASAPDLSWGYASFITALEARRAVTGD